MRKILVALAVVTLAAAGITGCSRAESAEAKLPATMETYYVTGSRTSEAILLEILQLNW